MKYRIVEYSDGFRIQKLYLEDDYFYFLSIYPIVKKNKKEVWKTILKDGNILTVMHWTHKDKYIFKSKEECLKIIEDLEKYPIYHYLKTNF